jgi:hypothetical protein
MKTSLTGVGIVALLVFGSTRATVRLWAEQIFYSNTFSFLRPVH